MSGGRSITGSSKESGIASGGDSLDIGSKREMLKIKIEQSRGEMQLLWERKMIIDTEVLAASIRLDALLNKYQSLQNR